MAGTTSSVGNSYGNASIRGKARVHQGDVKIEHANITILTDGAVSAGVGRLLLDAPHNEHTRRRGKNLAVLWIDAELQDGLLCLNSLKQFMERVAQAKGSDEVHKPCEFFDLIGGTDAGGLIALMLGRLELNISTCISRFLTLIEQVLYEPLAGYGQNDRNQVSGPVERSRMNEETVRNACTTVLQGRASKNELFQVTSAVTCKVFMDFNGPEANGSRQLRSYQCLTTQARVTLDKAVQAVLCASTPPSGQNLEDHVDFFMTISQITTNQGPQQGFVQALGDRFCQLNIASAQDHITESVAEECSARCVNRAAQHLVTPGFALLRACEQPLVSSDKRRDQRKFLDRISDYNPRLAHWKRSQPRVRDTCTWIFANKEFVKWRSTTDTSVLSCTGSVGCGKSMLAATVVDHLEQLNLPTGHGCVHYFFDSGFASATSLNDLLRAFLKQLLSMRTVSNALPPHLDQEIRDAFQKEVVHVSTSQLVLILRKVIDVSPQILYLIDGFDDMEESQIQRLLAFLRTTFASGNPHHSRLALFSREVLGRGIEVGKSLRTVGNLYEIRLSLIQLSDDISKFVEAQVEEQQLNRTITDDATLIADIKQRLKENGDKMFLWIHLQVLSIWNSDTNSTEDGIRALIDDLPDGIDATYARCLRRIKYHKNQHYRVLAARAFKWVAASRRALTHRQAQEAVSLNSENIEVRESAIINSPVTDYCGNLLTTDLSNRRIQFTHASVKSFLQDVNRLPFDLVEFRVDLLTDNLWCAELCFSYFDFLHSRKQLASRQEISIPGDVSQSFLNGVPWASKTSVVFRMFAKRTTSLGHVRPIPVPVRGTTEVTTLHMHDYFVNFWLAHTLEITPDVILYNRFRRYCLSFEPELFPWLENTTISAGLYQGLLQHAVLEGHAPMLRVIIEHIRRDRSYLMQSVFRSSCPGTSAHLIHMAAALGKVAIVAQLKPLCHVDVLDGDGRTPLAWAAESLHLEVVSYLVFKAAANVVACRRLSTDVTHPAYHDSIHSLNLLTTLVNQDTPDGFWEYFRNEPRETLKPCLSRSLISQALFAASCKGHTNVVKRLVRLGADPGHYSHFAWPGHPDGLQGWPVLVNLESAGVDAVIALVTAIGSSNPPSDKSTQALVSCIFTLTAYDAARLTRVLWQHKILRPSRSAFWHSIIANTVCPTPGDFLTERPCLMRPMIRSILHCEDTARLHPQESTPWQPTTTFWEYAINAGVLLTWLEQAPDDLLTMLMQSGVNGFEPSTNTHFEVIAQALSRRMSSRPLAVFLHKWYHPWASSPSWNVSGSHVKRAVLANAHTIGNRETLEFIVCYGEKTWLDRFDQSTFPDIDKKPILRTRNPPSHAAVEDVRSGLSDPYIEDYLCFRALRYCKQDVKKATQLVEDLRDINKELDLSLNFPAGYWKVGKRYAVKLSVVGSFCRWNWRLRRQKGLPLSDADTAYAKAAPECLQDLSMPAFVKQIEGGEDLWRQRQHDLSGPIRFKNTKQQDAIADLISLLIVATRPTLGSSE